MDDHRWKLLRVGFAERFSSVRARSGRSVKRHCAAVLVVSESPQVTIVYEDGEDELFVASNLIDAPRGIPDRKICADLVIPRRPAGADHNTPETTR